MKKSVLLITILLLLLGKIISAHEYWFEPDRFFLKPYENTNVRLFLGEALKKEEELAYQLAKTYSFKLFSKSGATELKPVVSDKALPIYNFSPEKEGNYLFALERNWSYIELSPKEFENYLREDGMEYIIDERKKLGESQNTGRERYSRFIKTLFQVGDKRDETFKQNANLKLEIIPLENPYEKRVGEKIKFQILFNNKPLINKTVFADNRNVEQITKQKMITDKNGIVEFELDNSGIWLVRLVYMQRCEEKNCGETDWESFWGAFSFGKK